MRKLAAILVFMLSAQPAPAGSCDMHDSDGIHGGVDMSAQAHMPHGGDGPAADHDCCDVDDSMDTGCSSPVQCGACVNGVAALTLTLATLSVAPPPAVPAAHGSERLTPLHTTHPFRPPKFIS